MDQQTVEPTEPIFLINFFYKSNEISIGFAFGYKEE